MPVDTPWRAAYRVGPSTLQKASPFPTTLADIGHYYRDYTSFMASFDDALPGRVHRVFYERMVMNTERQVRDLLDYVGLDFEDKCLAFYENDRAVRTASSEQVRQPIFRLASIIGRCTSLGLGTLRAALGGCYRRLSKHTR